ncbi:ribose-phosphate pyrophosphokinase [Sessilibacter sp. MAH1]
MHNGLQLDKKRGLDHPGLNPNTQTNHTGPDIVADLMLFSGNANPALAQAIADKLGIPLGKASVGKFSDGEITVELNDNVRGRDVFIIQPTCAPTNDNLMELIFMVDALGRASAGRITAVVPYFGYARQDRRVRSARVPISAKVVADMMVAVGVDRVLTVDLHSEQIQGFFAVPVDNVYGSPVLLADIERCDFKDLIVVSPDIGGVVRARAVAKQLDIDLAIIDKRRPRANVSEVMNLIGDVSGRTCILVDDMVDTAGTLCGAAKALKSFGAEKVVAYCTHAVLSGNAIKNINESELDELVVTDSIPLMGAAKDCDRIRQLSLAPMLAECMRRICNEESLSAMFR